MLTIPVLCYHSLNIDNNEYQGNDHVAFAQDLRLIHQSGRRVIPLQWLVDWLRGRRPDSDVAGGVVMSMDDGSWFDFHDMPHPSCGQQRGRRRLGCRTGTLHTLQVLGLIQSVPPAVEDETAVGSTGRPPETEQGESDEEEEVWV